MSENAVSSGLSSKVHGGQPVTRLAETHVLLFWSAPDDDDWWWGDPCPWVLYMLCGQSFSCDAQGNLLPLGTDCLGDHGLLYPLQSPDEVTCVECRCRLPEPQAERRIAQPEVARG